jgi:hypothetical protein
LGVTDKFHMQIAWERKNGAGWQWRLAVGGSEQPLATAAAAFWGQTVNRMWK